MDLQEFFTQIPKAANAFSGGADSAFLMWAAKQYGCDARAYYVKTAFQPEFELEDARRLAGELEIPMKVVGMDILSVPEAADNGPDRCYYCKRALFTCLRMRPGRTDIQFFWTARTLLMRQATVRNAGAAGTGCTLAAERVRPYKIRGQKAFRTGWTFHMEEAAYACLATRIPPERGSGPEIWKGWNRPSL